MDSSVTAAVSPQVKPRQFLNRFLAENLIKTPLEQEIYSRVWFTYRKDFHPLSGNPKYTTDCGWGCMLRSGQMLMAQALIQHHFNREWSLFSSIKTKADLDLYRDLVSLFNDRPNLAECPFGLHNLLEIADQSPAHSQPTESGVSGRSSRVGTWFGPSAVCLLLRDALNQCIKLNSDHYLLKNIRIYVAQDNTIYRKDVLGMCAKTSNENGEQQEFIPCIILISARLGGDFINKIYFEQLKYFFKMRTCIGMVGGKPKHSLYFIGYQGEKVIYLDPHLCQPSVNVFSTKSESRKRVNSLSRQQQKYSTLSQPIQATVKDTKKSSSKIQYDTYDLASSSASSLSSINSNDSELFDNTSFHCASPSKTAFSKLDPSVAIGFYCQTLKDFDELCHYVKNVA